MLLFACANCVDHTAPNQPAEVDAFITWFMATQEVVIEPVQPQSPQRSFTVADIDKIYPGVRTSSQEEKKRFGIQLIDDALAGRLAVRFSSGLPLARSR